MSNVTIALDAALLRRARDYAHRHGTTLNGLLRSCLERQVAYDDGSHLAADAIFQLADAAPCDPIPLDAQGGRGWTRAELQR